MHSITPPSLRNFAGACMLGVYILILGSPGAVAQEAKSAPPAASADTKDKATDKPTPLPPDTHVAQSIQFEGRPLHYTVTVGTLPVNDHDKKIGEVVFTAYTLDGQDRPVTFALNGGPGAASVYLIFGAIGPKQLEFGVEGRQPVRSGEVKR